MRSPVTSGRLFLKRLIGAAALDAATYEEVEADRGATAQAVAVVLLSSLGAGLGARGFGTNRVAAVLFFAALALMFWAGWALVTYQIGVRILPERKTRADIGELLRTLGFAAAPGIFRILGIVPGFTVPVLALLTVWMLMAMVVAVRQALDYTSTARAVAVCLLGAILSGALALLLALAISPTLS
jgi:hypothetical protein